MATNPAFEPDDIELGNSACNKGGGDIGNEEIPKKEADDVVDADPRDDTCNDDGNGEVSKDIADGINEKPVPDDFQHGTFQPESDNNDGGQSEPDNQDEGKIQQVKERIPSMGVLVFLI